MGVLSQTLGEIEQKMQAAFPEATVTTREIGPRIDVTVEGVAEDVEAVRRTVWEIIDSGAHLAFNNILSEDETANNWLLNASMTDGKEDKNITLTVSYFRQFARIQLSIVWPKAERTGRAERMAVPMSDGGAAISS